MYCLVIISVILKICVVSLISYVHECQIGCCGCWGCYACHGIMGCCWGVLMVTPRGGHALNILIIHLISLVVGAHLGVLGSACPKQGVLGVGGRGGGAMLGGAAVRVVVVVAWAGGSARCGCLGPG